MKRLLIVTAVIEVVAGLALLCFPSAMVALLLGSGLDTFAAAALYNLGAVVILATAGFGRRRSESPCGRQLSFTRRWRFGGLRAFGSRG